MTMKLLECTAGAVDAVFTCVTTAYARSASQTAVSHLLLPTVRSHSTSGVRLYEAEDMGWAAPWSDSKDANTGIDFTSFPIRLGSPADSPPVS